MEAAFEKLEEEEDIPDKFLSYFETNYVLQEAMENFVFPDKCTFRLNAMTKSLNVSTVDQQTFDQQTFEPLRMLG